MSAQLQIIIIRIMDTVYVRLVLLWITNYFDVWGVSEHPV